MAEQISSCIWCVTYEYGQIESNQGLTWFNVAQENYFHNLKFFFKSIYST